MKIYITGKVTGEPLAECTMKFGLAQKQLEELGHEAINPLEVVIDKSTRWDQAMRKCLAALMTADGIYALADSLDSPGATIELEIARKVNINIYTSLKEIPNQIRVS